MTSKVGYFLMNKASGGRNWSADEDYYLTGHLRRLNPGAMLYLDDDGKALLAKTAFPDCAVVGRLYSPDIPEGQFWFRLTPQQVFDRYKNTPKGIIRNIGNEPLMDVNEFSRFATWCAEVMDLFGNAGIPIVLPNWGEGNPALDHFDLLEPLWKAFDKWHDLHDYGTHEYGSHYGLLFNQSTNHDMFPWRVGRFERFTVPYLQAHGHKIPNVIITEFGCDSAHDGTAFRGWKTCWNETQYFTEIKAAVETVYNKPYYKGLCLYTWGNTGTPNTESDWTTFDVSEAKGLHQSLEQYAASNTPAQPFDYGTMLDAHLNVYNVDAINLRADTNTNSVILAHLLNDTDIKISERFSTAQDHNWFKVAYQGTTGYIADTSNWHISAVISQPPPETAKKAILDAIASIENDLAGIVGSTDNMHIELQRLKALVKDE